MARRYGFDLGTEQAHAEHVRRLPLDIRRTHVDDTGQAEARGDGGGGDPVLARAGFGDDPRLAHFSGQQDLPETVVDLVRARVVQLVALEIDLRSAELFRQPFGEIKWAGPARIVRVEVFEFGLERGACLCRLPGFLQVQDQRHQRFGYETTAEYSKTAFLVGTRAEGIWLCRLVHWKSS